MLELVFHPDIRDTVALWRDKVAKKSGLLDIYDIVAGLEIMRIRADNPLFKEFKTIMEQTPLSPERVKEFVENVTGAPTKSVDLDSIVDPRQLSTPDEFVSYISQKYKV